MGDPSKIVLLERVLEVMKRDNLLNLVLETGQHFKCGLHQVEKEFPNMIHSVRGRGTLLAFTACSPQLRDKIIVNLKKCGKFDSFTLPGRFWTIPTIFYVIKARYYPQNVAYLLPFYLAYIVAFLQSLTLSENVRIYGDDRCHVT